MDAFSISSYQASRKSAFGASTRKDLYFDKNRKQRLRRDASSVSPKDNGLYDYEVKSHAISYGFKFLLPY